MPGEARTRLEVIDAILAHAERLGAPRGAVVLRIEDAKFMRFLVDDLAEALRLVFHETRSVREDEPPERRIPTQIAAGDIRRAHRALARLAEEAPQP